MTITDVDPDNVNSFAIYSDSILSLDLKLTNYSNIT